MYANKLIEQGLMSPPTQYRSSGRQFYRSKDPTNSIKVLKENSWPATDRKRLQTHQGFPPCYKYANKSSTVQDKSINIQERKKHITPTILNKHK